MADFAGNLLGDSGLATLAKVRFALLSSVLTLPYFLQGLAQNSTITTVTSTPSVRFLFCG
jgi:hypothetical protein